MQVVAVTDPLAARLRPPGDDRRPGQRRRSSRSPTQLAAIDEVDYVVITAGSYDLLVEVVCESDEHLLELISQQIRTDRPASWPPRPSCTSSCASRPTPGACAEPLGPRGYRSAARCGTSTPTTPWAPRPGAARRPRRPTWPSWAAATPASGRRTTSLEADPTLRIAVLEAEMAGFGASGRNGGWCSALFPASLDRLARLSPAGQRPARWPSTRRCAPASTRSGRVAAAEGIDADYAKGGTVVAGPHRQRSCARRRREVAHARGWGRGDDELTPARRRPRPARVLARRAARSGRPTPPTARRCTPPGWCAVSPSAVERRGVTVHEQTRCCAIEPGRVVTDRGVVRAEVVLRATEGYTAVAARASAAPWCRSTRWWWRPSRCPPTAWERDRPAPSARRSPTTATSSSTASAPPTTGWSSAAAGRRTTSGRGSRPDFDRDERVSTRPCAARWPSCSRC